LACGAFGNAKFFDEIIQREWIRCDEKQAVDFTDGARESENTDAIDKKVHDLLLNEAKVLALGFGSG
jgi:hypothetical protein